MTDFILTLSSVLVPLPDGAPTAADLNAGGVPEDLAGNDRSISDVETYPHAGLQGLATKLDGISMRAADNFDGLTHRDESLAVSKATSVVGRAGFPINFVMLGGKHILIGRFWVPFPNSSNPFLAAYVGGGRNFIYAERTDLGTFHAIQCRVVKSEAPV